MGELANWSIESVVINMKEDYKDNVIKNLLSNQKGMALLTTLIFVFVLVTFGLSLLIMTSNDTKLSALQRDSTKAFYIAEAGIERTLYNLKKDFESSEDWNDGDINGYPLTDEDANGFQKIEYDGEDDHDVFFGDGTYTVALKINSSDYVTIKSKGKYDNSIRYVQVDAKIEKLSIWGNGIFGGSGASDSVISGKVDIRGSVHILGEGLSSDDTAIEIIGAAGIGNNYIGMDFNLRSRVIDPPTNGLGDQTLNAKLRVKHGKVNISGNATVGDPDEPGNGFKETMDGVYVTDGFGGNQGESNVYSDNGTDQRYDLGEGTLEFPTLDDLYIDPETGNIFKDEYEQTYTYLQYYEKYGLNITETHEKYNLVSSISSDTESFTIGSKEVPNEYGKINYIDWNQASGILQIGGIICVDNADGLVIGKAREEEEEEETIIFDGKGTLVSAYPEADIFIHDHLLSNGGFPTEDSLGLISAGDINVATGEWDDHLNIMGAFYAENQITSAKQNEIAGTFVSNYIDMGNQVPSIYQVPELINNIPPGMPGATITYSIYTNNWHEVYE